METRHLEANTIKFCEFEREGEAVHLSIDVDNQSLCVCVCAKELFALEDCSGDVSKK